MEVASDESIEIWNNGHERLLVSIAYKCQSVAWMHLRSQDWYETVNFWLTIPSIVIGTLSGSATLGLNNFPQQAQQSAQICIGLATISCGVLTSINNFMKTNARSESHRSASLAYSKLYRAIQSELALQREQRVHPMDFLKIVRAEQDRLHESMPQPLQTAFAAFRKQFSKTPFHGLEVLASLSKIYVNGDPDLELASGEANAEDDIAAAPYSLAEPLLPPTFLAASRSFPSQNT